MDNLKDHVFKEAGETIRRHTPFNPRSNTEETTEKIALTIEQAQKAKNQHERKLDKDTIRHAKGEITEEELDETRETQDALEKIAEVQSQLFNLQNSIEKESQAIENFKKHNDPKSEGYTPMLQGMEDALKTYQDTFEKQEKFLMDYIDKNEDAKRVLMRWGEDPIKRQKGGFIVPGNTTGDSFPAMLPEGSLVLNRNAVPHFQKGGMVPTLLEPREQVLYPGNFGMREVMLNKAFPRFQTGGIVQLGKDMVGQGYKAWQHPDFNLDRGYTGSGNERNMVREYDSRHNHNAALDFPGSHNTIAQLDQLYAKLNTPEAKEKYGITQLLWRGVEGHGPNLAPDNYHVHVAVGGAQDFRGHGGGGNQKSGAAKDDTESGNTSGGGNIIDNIVGGFGMAGQAIGAVYEAFMEVFGEDLGALFDFSGGGGGGDDGGGKSGTPSGTGPVDMGKDVNEKLKSMAKLAMDAGFTKDQAKIMAAIAGGESTFDNTAHNTNRGTGDNSYGLWQINMIDELGPERRKGIGISSNEELFDPATNARAAKYIFDRQGFTAWGAYTDGNAAEYMNAAQALELQRGGMVGNVSSMSGSYSSNFSDKSEEQFIEKLASSVTPVINLIPAHQHMNNTVGETSNQTTPPTLSAYPNNNVALDLRNRVSINTAFS